MNVRALRVMSWLGVLLPIVAYTFSIYNYPYNFPLADDYDAILSYGNSVKSAIAQPFQILQLTLSRHNEHRPFLLRVAVLVQLITNGEINFRQLILFGSVSLLLLFLGLIQLRPRSVKLTIASSITACFIFQPVLAEATHWATTAWTFPWVYAFAFLSLQYGKLSTIKSHFFALIFGLLALSMANGVLVFFCLFLMALSSRRTFSAFLWVGLLLLSCFYLIGAQLNLGVSKQLGLQNLSWQSCGDVIVAFFQLCGSAPGFTSHSFSLFWGVLIFSLFIVSFLKTKSANLRLSYCLVFVYCSAAMISIGRFGLDTGYAYTTSRYSLLSSLIFAGTFSLSLNAFAKERWVLRYRQVLLWLSFMFCLSSYWRFYSNLQVRGAVAEESHLAWTFFREGLSHPDTKEARAVLERSLGLGIFAPDLPQPVVSKEIRSDRCQELQPDVDSILTMEQGLTSPREKGVQYLYLSGWYHLLSSMKDSSGFVPVVILRNNSGYRCFEAIVVPRFDVESHLRSLGYAVTGKTKGFRALIKLSDPEVMDVTADKVAKLTISGGFVKDSARVGFLRE